MMAPPAAPPRRVSVDDPYRHLDPGERYLHEARDRALFALLARHDIRGLAGRRIVELGCGAGSLLRMLRAHGADPGLLQGVDVDRRGVRRARELAGVTLGDVASLPYRDGAFDLAFAFTLLSSVLDREARRRAVAEALRALRSGGLLVVYDFWTNPLNRRTRPLRASELRALAAPRPVEVERVTLAPPIARALGGRPGLCGLFERLPPLRTHLLAAVVKEA